MRGWLILAAFTAAGPVAAQSVDGPKTWRDGGILVTEGDLGHCPYRPVGDIEANVHSSTIFGKRPVQAKVVREMRERAAKVGADAVVHAAFSPEHATAVWGRVVSGTGVAVKFAGDCSAVTITASK